MREPGLANTALTLLWTGVVALALAGGGGGHRYGWGSNEFGQLGNGTNADTPTPVRVELP